MTRGQIMRLARRWHDRLMWPAAFALACWAISGLTHPLMSWTGPSAQTMRPPQITFDAQTWNANLAPALQVRDRHGPLAVVPTEQGAMLRVGVVPSAERAEPALYFAAGALQGYGDVDQAIWLARHYLGAEPTSEVTEVNLVTEFNPRYPSVNRLLPVWQVHFAGDLHAFVHTETGSLASVGDSRKQRLQQVFQWLHTHSYLAKWPWLQFIWSFALISTLVVFALAGTVLIFAMPKRKHITPGSRRWHRRAALVLYVPLLALSTSGLYHVVFTHFDDKQHGQQFVSTAAASDSQALAVLDELNTWPAQAVQQSSLVQTPNGEPFIRLQHTRAEAPETREARFAGHAAYTQVTYLGAQAATNTQSLTDRDLATLYVAGIRDDAPLDINLVTSFGGLYDFRNKRLPVWQFDYADEVIFIDPARQVVVERVAQAEQWERWSFSQLHKWNFLTPWMGRSNRDILVALAAIGFLLMLALGVAMSLKRPRKTAKGA